MKTSFNRLLFVIIAVLGYANIISCATNGTKLVPEYKGIDPKVQGYVDEYKNLAKMQGITFKNDVTIGFKKINHGNAVGITHYGFGWREIDVDRDYFNKATPITKWNLMVHELTHAFCTRVHDYADGKEYSETEGGQIKEYVEWKMHQVETPARYAEGCPKSLMYPELLNDECITLHYNDYIVELFARCDPW